MRVNEASWERVLRVIVGVVLLAMTPQIGGMLGYPINGISSVWAWIGVVPIITGLVGWCPVYSILGISTCPRKAA